MTDDFEKASRYREGELPAEEMKALEASGKLPDQLETLKAIDAAARSLPMQLDGEKLKAMVARVKRPEPASGAERKWVPTAIAAVAAAVIGMVATGAVNLSSRRAWWVVPTGQVQLDGEGLSQSRLLGTRERWALEVSPDATAQLFSRAQGALWLPAGARVINDRKLALERGSVLVSAHGLVMTAGDQQVQVDGTAVLSMEPPEGLTRVTDVLNQFPSGEQMKSHWVKLSSVAATAAAVSSGLTLFVVEGHASVGKENATPIRVEAGERAGAGDAKATSWKPTDQVAALTGSPTRPGAGTTTPEPTMQRGDPRLKAMSQPELVALAERLLDEKEAVLREREELKKKLSEAETGGGHEDRNYYRFQPEELLASAKKGELRLRGPQLLEEEFKLDAKVREDVALTPDEEAKVKAIYQASRERARAATLTIYGEIGGDPGSAGTLATHTLFNEIRGKALKGDFANAVRQLANERAGLAQPVSAAAQTPIMRALKVFIEEDERVIAELEQLLGHRRAEEFLNHENSSHSNSVYGVGPAKPK